jgi:hypothetical protein
MTVGVYGLVAGIVKLDDAGLYLSQNRAAARARDRPHAAGRRAAPDEIPVGRRHRGHVHGRRRHLRCTIIPKAAGRRMGEVPVIGGVLHGLGPVVFDRPGRRMLVGALVLLVVTLVNKCVGKKAAAEAH